MSQATMAAPPAAFNLPSALVEQLPTPCLLIDLPAVDRNIERAAAHFRAGPVRLRPHFKAHKCTTLLKRQLAAGGCSGVTCQTAAEALVLARAQFGDILVANEIVDPAALDDLAKAANLSRITVAVDSLRHVELLQHGAESAGTDLGVVIELDVGLGRCGLPVDSPSLLVIAKAITASPNLKFRGLQAYEGHVVMREDRELRRTSAWQAYAQVSYERSRLEASGFPCELVSGGGTGTLDLAVEGGVLTEVQAGSYVLMDGRYASLDLPFDSALCLAARVVSRRAPDAGVLNAGWKELSAEYGLPKAISADISVIALADEHTRIKVGSGDKPEIGDIVLLIPGHVDPTVNLHDAFLVWDGANSLDTWQIDGRRATPGTGMSGEGGEPMQLGAGAKTSSGR